MPNRDPMKKMATDRKGMRAFSHRLRVRTLMFFGGRCERCGNNDMRVLQMDHKNGGGYRDRQVVGASGQKYRDGTHVLNRRALNHPADFQLLCANCNWIKRFEHGEHGGDKGYLAVAVGG